MPEFDIRRWLRRRTCSQERYEWVLGMVLLVFLLIQVAGDIPWPGLLVVVTTGALLPLTLYAVCSERRWVLVGIGAMLVSALAVALVHWASTARMALLVTGSLSALLLIGTQAVILGKLASPRQVTGRTLLGAAAAYVLFGTIFAFVYLLLDMATAGPLFFNAPPPTLDDYLFFSYVTLTTVGYGEPVPQSDLVRAAAMLEAMLGQAYLFVIVGHLVYVWHGKAFGRK